MAMTGFQNLARLMGEAVVTVLVGLDEKRYTVHKALLTTQSEYFERALNGKFKEADEQTVRLTEESPDAFDLLVGWLYQGRIPVVSSAFDAVRSGQDTKGGVYGPSKTSKSAPFNAGTSPVEYTPVEEPTVGLGQVFGSNTSTDRYDHICRQPFYEGASPEELRLADYERGRRFAWQPMFAPRLPEEFPLATGHVKGIPQCPSMESITVAEEAHQLSLLRLCLFAETICWTPLFNLAMTAYVQGENNLRRPMPKEHIQLIYQRAHDESPCRRFAADSAIAQIGSAGQVDRNMDLVDQCPSFLEDIFRRMSLRTTLTQSSSPKNMLPCEYHDHKTQAESVRCSAIGPAQRPVQYAVDPHTATSAAATSIFRPFGETVDCTHLDPESWDFSTFRFAPVSAASPYQPNAQAGASSSAAAGGSTTAVVGAARDSLVPAAELAGSASLLLGPTKSVAQQSTAPATVAMPFLLGTSSLSETSSLLGQNQPAGLPSTITSTSTTTSAVSLPSTKATITPSTASGTSSDGALGSAMNIKTAQNERSTSAVSLPSTSATLTHSIVSGTSSDGSLGSATNTKTAQNERSPRAVFGQVSPLGSKLPPKTVAASASGAIFGSSSRAVSAASTSSSGFSGTASFATTAASSRQTSASSGIFGTFGAASKASSGGLFGGASVTTTNAFNSAGVFGGAPTSAPFSFGGSMHKTSPSTAAIPMSAPSSHSIFGSASAVPSASAFSGASGDSISAADIATALQTPLSDLFSNTRLPGVSNPGLATVTLPPTNATPVFSATASAPRDVSVSNVDALRSKPSLVRRKKDENTDPRVRARARQRIRYK